MDQPKGKINWFLLVPSVFFLLLLLVFVFDLDILGEFLDELLIDFDMALIILGIPMVAFGGVGLIRAVKNKQFLLILFALLVAVLIFFFLQALAVN